MSSTKLCSKSTPLELEVLIFFSCLDKMPLFRIVSKVSGDLALYLLFTPPKGLGDKKSLSSTYFGFVKGQGAFRIFRKKCLEFPHGAKSVGKRLVIGRIHASGNCTLHAREIMMKSSCLPPGLNLSTLLISVEKLLNHLCTCDKGSAGGPRTFDSG